MSMSNALIAKISGSMDLLEKFRAIIVENYDASVPDEVKCVLEALPYEIAEAQIMGLNYAVAMSLREGFDFAEPSRLERFRSKKPKLEILRPTSRAVFAYCLDNGLQPEFSPYTRGDDGKLRSEITIQWAPHLLENRSSKAIVDGSFLQDLRVLHANSNTPRQLIVRSRISGAIEKLPKLLRDIELAATRGEQSVGVYTQLVPMHHGNTKLPDLTSDLKAFFELLDLTVDVRKGHGSMSSMGNVYSFELVVSGWA